MAPAIAKLIYNLTCTKIYMHICIYIVNFTATTVQTSTGSRGQHKSWPSTAPGAAARPPTPVCSPNSWLGSAPTSPHLYHCWPLDTLHINIKYRKIMKLHQFDSMIHVWYEVDVQHRPRRRSPRRPSARHYEGESRSTRAIRYSTAIMSFTTCKRFWKHICNDWECQAKWIKTSLTTCKQFFKHICVMIESVGHVQSE